MRIHLWTIKLLLGGLAMLSAGCSDDNDTLLEPDMFHSAEGLDDREVHWGYSGTEGPEYWGELSEEYALCASGDHQSPVDFPGNLDSTPLGDLEFDYASTPATLVDNGHTVVVGFENAAASAVGENVVLLGGEAYTLLQLHFHADSEHRVAGVAYPLEMHLVHQSASARLAVVGVLFEEGPSSEVLRGVFDEMSSSSSEPSLLEDSIDLSALLPQDTRGWAYSGSLTTPPCSEGVNWNVFSQSLTASASQLRAFTDLHPGSNRPVLDNSDVREQASSSP